MSNHRRGSSRIGLLGVMLLLIASVAVPERAVESHALTASRPVVRAHQLAVSGVSVHPDRVENRPLLVGGSDLAGSGVVISDAGGNNDEAAQPGEIIAIRRSLVNTGTMTATDTTGVVSVITGQVAMVQPSASYPPIAPGQLASNTTPYQAFISPYQRCPDILTFRQVVTSAGTSSVNLFEVPVGIIPSATFTSTATPAELPFLGGPAGTYHPITVTAPITAVVEDVDVRLTITHTWVNDLRISLVSPGGITVSLFRERGAEDADDLIGAIFDDQTTLPIAAGAAPFSGRFRPESPLAAFAGQPMAGAWQLYVVDTFINDTGTLLSFGLDFNKVACAPVLAQTGIITGKVTDIHNGAPLSNALVSVPVSALEAVTMTSAVDGSYRLAVPAGPITIAAAEPRYNSLTLGALINPGVTTTINLPFTGYPRLLPAGIVTDIVTLGNGNGIVEPGDGLIIQLPLTNTGTNTATTTSGTVLVTGGSATMVQPTSLYPTIGLSVTRSNLVPYVAYVDPALRCGDFLSFQQVVTTNFGITSTQGFSYRTGTPISDVVTTTYNYSGPPVGIPGPTTSLTDVAIIITTTIPQLVGDVDVRLNINHTWDSDLRLSLVSPQGSVVLLAGGLGNDQDNYLNTVFDDQAATSITAGSPPFTGRFRPQSPLAAFAGQVLSGTWKLRVEDTVASDGGTINAFSLDVLPMNFVCQPVVRPAPALTALGPLSNVIGSPDFELTVSGVGYYPYFSTVLWNGTPLSTSFVSSTTLQAAVPASLVAPTGPAIVGPGPLVPAGPISITVQTIGVVTPSNTLTFDLAKANQTITFSPLVTRTVGDPAFTVTATATTGLPVSFSAQASPIGACILTGTLVTIVAAGSCTVTASQSGNESYNPAPGVARTFRIVPPRVFLPVTGRAVASGW